MGGVAFGSRCDGADRRAGCPKGAFPSSTAAASPPWPDHHGETSRCVLPCKQRSGARLATMPACAVRIPIINMQSCVPMCSDAVLLRPALGFSCSSVARLGGVSERPCTLLKRVSRPGVPGCAERRSGRREGACPTQRAQRGPLNIEPRIVMPAPLGGLEAGRVARSALYATLYHVLWQGCVERRCIYQSLQQKCTPTTHTTAPSARSAAAPPRVESPPPLPPTPIYSCIYCCGCGCAG